MPSENSEANTSSDRGENKTDNLLVKIGRTQYSLSNIALLLMLAGVLIPSVVYSVNLKNPSPAELLVAISIALFSSVLFLWIMDATSVLRFRAEWVSKSIYGAAIASIIGTSVAVYNNAFTDRKYPYEGRWEIFIETEDSTETPVKHSAVIMYSESAQTYWGYSNYKSKNSYTKGLSSWINIEDFDPKLKNIKIELFRGDCIPKSVEMKVIEERHGKIFKNIETDALKFCMSRTK